MDASIKDIMNIKAQLKAGKYILIKKDLEFNRIRVLTRYNGRYITFVTTEDFNILITALEYNKNMFESIEQYVKEFD